MSALPSEFARLLPDAAALASFAEKLSAAREHQTGYVADELEPSAAELVHVLKRVPAESKKFHVWFSAHQHELEDASLTEIVEACLVIKRILGSLLSPSMQERGERPLAQGRRFQPIDTQEPTHLESDELGNILNTVQDIRWAVVMALDSREPSELGGAVLATAADVRAMFAELDKSA